jgi:PKD repeat protein
LQRGFAGSIQGQWSKGTPVTCAVFAEHHNAIKDAVINIENYVGTSINPTSTSLCGLLKDLETKLLTPRPLFRAYPILGRSPLMVRFQNCSGTHVVRSLWDFGDGSTSSETSPTHTYNTEGKYTVSLNVITVTGSQGIATKNNYITVDDSHIVPFFYVTQTNLSNPAYSQETATLLGASPATFLFVDQTLGEVTQRFWDFGDGETFNEVNPNTHTTTHIYNKSGTYDPTLIDVFGDQTYKRAILTEQLTVL